MFTANMMIYIFRSSQSAADIIFSLLEWFKAIWHAKE